MVIWHIGQLWAVLICLQHCIWVLCTTVAGLKLAKSGLLSLHRCTVFMGCFSGRLACAQALYSGTPYKHMQQQFYRSSSIAMVMCCLRLVPLVWLSELPDC